MTLQLELKTVKALVFMTFLALFYCNSPARALAENSNLQVEDRLNSIEDGLNVLQKYVYNLNSGILKDAANNASAVHSAASTEEIGEQFQLIRGDIESLRQEVASINDRLSKFASEIEHKLSDSDHLVKEQSKNHVAHASVETKADELKQAVKNTSLQSNSESSVENQFKKAYLLFKEKKHQEAKSAFEHFIKNNPKSSLIGAAYYWIGQIYTQKEEYDKAAVEYLKGYQAGASSGRASDNLLMLSDSLLRIGKRRESCVTLEKFAKEFPDIPSSLKRRAQELTHEGMCAVKD